MASNTNLAFTSSFFGNPLSVSKAIAQLPKCAQRPSICAVGSPPSATAKNDKREANAEDGTWQPGKIRAPRPKRYSGGSRRRTVRIQGKYYRATVAPTAPGLRITSGSIRGRRIQSPNVYLRPMMGKVREALFSMLDMFEILRSDGAVLDLFAGSGSIGIEAMSRGMGKAVFVDASMECADTIERNLKHCELEERGRAVCSRAEDFVINGASYNDGRHFDLITLTPPYEEVDYAELMNAVALSPCVGEGTFVVVEYPVEMKTMPPVIEQRLIGIRNRRYGRTVLALYACQPDIDIDRRSEEFVNVRRKRMR